MKKIDLLRLAIENEDYKISFGEPNNIELCTRYDGTKFYIIRDDGIKFGVDGGCCHIEIAGYSFTCDLGTGDWELDDVNDSDDNDEYVDDNELIELLESIPDVLSGVMLSPDEQMEVYFRANPEAEELDYFWCEDDEKPTDIDRLGWGDAYLLVEYKTIESEEWDEAEITIEDTYVYKLYLLLKDIEGFDGIVPAEKEYRLSDTQIKAFDKELYDTIIYELSKEIDNYSEIQFVIPVDASLFNCYL